MSGFLHEIVYVVQLPRDIDNYTRCFVRVPVKACAVALSGSYRPATVCQAVCCDIAACMQDPFRMEVL